MKAFKKLVLFGLVVVFNLQPQAQASHRSQESEPLDIVPLQIVQVNEDRTGISADPLTSFWAQGISNLKAAIANQTPVKAQGHRGTCSIFSANGALESLLKIQFGKNFDLSENYLEYLVVNRMKQTPTEGSDVPLNYPALKRWGTFSSSVWPYEESDWTEGDLSEEEAQKVEETCGGLVGNRKTGCLLSHMDPQRDLYANEAAQFANKFETNRLGYQSLRSQSQIQQILNYNYPVILSVRFFYKAWNHRLMTQYGLGPRDMVKWEKGIVSSPTQQDLQVAQQHPAGHSVVIVGYNDSERVYYFKNSWGIEGFGAGSNLLGAGTTAGYGKISYDYAHNYGTFYQVGFANRPIR